jgi:membrane dipeptidase
MGLDKRYDGYEAYDYLDTADYRTFELAGEHAGDPYEVPLDDEEEARVERLVRETPVISLHEHAFRFPADLERIDEYVREGRCHTGYEFLADSPLDGVFDMHLDGLSGIHSKNGWKYEDVIDDVGTRRCDHAHSDVAVTVEDVDDLRRAHEEGRVGMVAALESSMPIENELDRIETLYGLGVRSMGITYIQSNALGTGGGDDYGRDGGLTAFGAEAVGRMNDVGMAISVSHASERTAIDACEVSAAPVLDTHTRPAMDDPDRGASDEKLRAVADTGGVAGIVASSTIPDIETYMEGFEYVLDLVGPDHVAFGPDVLYGDHRRLLQVLGRQYDVDVPEEIGGRTYVKGLENPTEAWHNIPRWLVAEGYDDRTIEKVLGGNVLRVLSEVW